MKCVLVGTDKFKNGGLANEVNTKNMVWVITIYIG